MIVYVVLTEACNLACPHCIRGKQRDVYMARADFARIIAHLDRRADVSAIILTGGEPLVHPEFDSFLSDVFANFSRRIVITTNGTLNLPPMIEALSQQDRGRLSVQISLDGPEVVNDSIRGAGAYKKVHEFASALNNIGIVPSIATTVSKSNYEVVEQLAEDLKQLSILRWSVNLAAPMGRCDEGNTVEIASWNDLVDRVKALQLPYGVNIKVI